MKFEVYLVSWIILILVILLVSIKNRNLKREMRVSVIIPAYNEHKTVGHVVNVVKTLNYIDEIIVVDDGSTDETAKIAEKAGATVIRHPENKGKGAALKTGFKNSNGDVVAFIDADLQNLTSKQVDGVIKPILEGEADVTKTKFKREAGRVTELTAKPLLNFFFPELKFDQPLSGQFAAKRSFLNNIKLEDDYGVDVGIVLDADVMGMNIKEVDIGKIKHTLSSLKELNIVANEVVRTIVDRAMEYGRVTIMDALGKYIRMGVLGLSLASLGIFAIFFIRFVPLTIGAIITVIGMVIALYYIIKLIRRSLYIFSRSDGKYQSIRSFFYMHFPVLISGLILIAMMTTLLGYVHVDDGRISIEPASRNFIYWTEPLENRSFDLRGPYTVDSALENENNILRLTPEAKDTLELNYGDLIYINEQKYTVNQSRFGDENILRIPLEARNFLDLNVGDIIPDSNIRKIFKNLYAKRYLETNKSVDNNLKIQEGVFIKTDQQKGRKINIFLNDKKIATTSGILENDGSYGVYIDGIRYKTIKLDKRISKNVYYLYWGDDIIKIEIDGEIDSDMEFSSIDDGRFLNFIFSTD